MRVLAGVTRRGAPCAFDEAVHVNFQESGHALSGYSGFGRLGAGARAAFDESFEFSGHAD
jgi:hypothetical protein